MSNVPKLFDIHTHTQFAAYEKDSTDVIKRALDQNIWLVNIGTQKDTSAKAVEIANSYAEGVYATAGLHPIHTERAYHDKQELGVAENKSDQFMSIGAGPQKPGDTHEEFYSRQEEFDYDYYKNLAQDKKIVAIGECGLDYYRLTPETKNRQKEIFTRHIALASELKKPLMIHCRNAFADLLDILNSKFKILHSNPGIVHFFSGTINDAERLLELGFSFSFGGVLTFTRDYDEQVKYIPLDKILLETDAPYVAPAPYRGKRNEPAYVVEVAKKLAELKGKTFDEVAEKTTENAMKIFNF